MYSQQLSKYYDELMGDNPHILNTAKELVHTYVSKRGQVLELGCGTGTVLKELAKDYVLSGLDIAPGMIEVARKKVPSATYYVDDMTTFSLPQKYDAILCLFDSINHLITVSQWESTFQHVSGHLKKNGIFIFDMNTMYRLNGLSTLPTNVKKINNSLLSTAKISRQKRNLFSVTFQVFDHLDTPEISYFEETVFELGVSLPRIRKLLEPTFEIKKMIDPFRPRISRDTGRIFFVCKLK